MWDAFKDAIFWCIDAMYGFVADWGLAIIIVTLILRLILFPLMQKQIRSSYRMQQFSPRIQEIQEKYGDVGLYVNPWAEAVNRPVIAAKSSFVDEAGSIQAVIIA